VDVRVVRPVKQFVAGARAVNAQQHLDRLDVLARDLVEGRFGDRDLIGGVGRAGVAGTQRRGHRLACLSQ